MKQIVGQVEWNWVKIVSENSENSVFGKWGKNRYFGDSGNNKRVYKEELIKSN